MLSRKTFITLLLLGIAFRLVLLTNYDLVNGGEIDMYLADEGIVGLMGKHILEGTALPVFFYGQHYLGALEAYLAAASFALFGVGLLSLRLVAFVSSLAVLWAVYAFTRRACSQQAARWATAIVSLPPVYFLQWNLKARGGFVEHIFLLFAVLILFWRYTFGGERRPGLALALGLVAGIAFWVNQLIVAYFCVLVPALWLGRSQPYHWGRLIAGFLVGASLLVGYNAVYPLATVRTLARKAITLNRVPVAQRDEHWLKRGIEKRIEALGQGADKLGVVFGVPARTGVTRLGLSEQVRKAGPLTRARQFLALFPLVVLLSSLLMLRPRWKGKTWQWHGPGTLSALLFAMTFLVGYVSPRYMLPAYPLGAVICAMAQERSSERGRPWLTAGMVVLICYALLSWVDLPAAVERGSQARIEGLVGALERDGLTRCYSAGSMYHAVFASGERVIIAPLQKDRYPAYGEIVGRAPRVCYLFRDDQRRKRQHVAFMQLLARKQVTYREMRVGIYTVLYDFAPRRAITEEEMTAVRRQERTHLGIKDVIPSREPVR